MTHKVREVCKRIYRTRVENSKIHDAAEDSCMVANKSPILRSKSKQDTRLVVVVSCPRNKKSHNRAYKI